MLVIRPHFDVAVDSDGINSTADASLWVTKAHQVTELLVS